MNTFSSLGALAVFAATGCTPPSGWAVACDVAIVADEASTVYVQSTDPRARETNLFLGSRPSDAMIALDGAIKIAIVHVADHYLPAKWRPLPAMIWMFVESYAVVHNLQLNADN